MRKIILLFLIFNGLSSFADEELDALIETQKLLRDSARVQSEALQTPQAKRADRKASITALGKPELKQEIYNISSDLMSWLEQAAKGDPAKMQELMIEANKNPKAFYDRIPAAERTKIKALAEKIEQSRKKKSP